MKLAVLYSGGKDSTMALYRVMKKGHDIATLVTMLPDTPESYMFHYPNVKWTKVQAFCMHLPIIQRRTKGIKEQEVEDLKRVLSELDVDGVVSGALASRYQKSRIDRICKELGIKSIAPLWQKAEKRLFKEIVDLGFEIIVTGVAAEGLDESWLGRVIDWEAIDELADMGQVHIMFEGGEAETFVTDGPIFRQRIKITKAKRKWDGTRGEYEIEEVKVLPKELSMGSCQPQGRRLEKASGQ
ncbi:MAG: TIGR00289 family protein [Candidatus Diapherotrites archaeon]|nr:TIGR00289 family protein [Candidatus Diapherotrites archaeon]